MNLAAYARETVERVQQGHYTAPSGARVELSATVAAALEGTRLYRPGEPARAASPRSAGAPAPRVEVTAESTGAAAARLVRQGHEVVLLNFASAKNPGGGFLGGARAQEEDLARCSALYACQLTQPEYYAANRREPSMLYTDHLIYSPRVPFFRGEDGVLLEAPFLASVITSPAPNAGEHRARCGDDDAGIRAVLLRRAAQVLAVAELHGHKTVVLGAWGCGVFKNDPEVVADVFRELLAEPRPLERVVFAVLARGRERKNLEAFEARWPDGAHARSSDERAVASALSSGSDSAS
jgi:uncharacterized protein (TIGR02452 family)